MVTTSAPWPVRRARISGLRITLINSALSWAITEAGVPWGTSTPCQVPDSKPFSPCSARVGISPTKGIRVDLEIPNTLSLPLCTWGSVANMPFISTWVCPAMVSAIA